MGAYPKAVIFDLDGTLVYTNEDFRYVMVERICKDLNIPIPSRHHIDAIFFLGSRHEIIKNELGVDPELFWDTYNKHDNEELHDAHTGPYDDTTALQELRSHGCKFAVVTGSHLTSAKHKCAMIRHCAFETIISCQPQYGIELKPHPQGLLMALEKLGVDKNDAVYVGNGEEDVAMAQNAGVTDIFIDRGEHDFSHVTPTYSIKTLAELPEMLKNLRKHVQR